MCHLKHSLSVDFVVTLLVVYYLDKKTCSFTQRNNNNKTLVNPPNVSKSHWDLRGAKSLHPSYKLCQNLDSSWTFCSLANFGIRVLVSFHCSYGIRVIHKSQPAFIQSLGTLSPPIPSFGGIHKVMKFY